MKSILLTASMLCIASAVNIRGTQAVHPLDLPREPQGKTGIQDSHAFKGIAPSWMQAEMPKITASNPCDGSAETCPPQGVLRYVLCYVLCCVALHGGMMLTPPLSLSPCQTSICTMSTN